MCGSSQVRVQGVGVVRHAVKECTHRDYLVINFDTALVAIPCEHENLARTVTVPFWDCRRRSRVPFTPFVNAHQPFGRPRSRSTSSSSRGSSGIRAAAALAAAGDKGWMSDAASQIAADMRREEKSFALSDGDGNSKYTSRGTRRIGKRKRGRTRSRRRQRQTVLTKRRLVSSWCSEEERQQRAKRQVHMNLQLVLQSTE